LHQNPVFNFALLLGSHMSFSFQCGFDDRRENRFDSFLLSCHARYSMATPRVKHVGS